MTITLPKLCAEGKCDHADYPHKLIETERTVKTPYRDVDGIHVASYVERHEQIICLGCGHWPASGARASCKCPNNCHEYPSRIAERLIDSEVSASQPEGSDHHGTSRN